MSFKPVQCKAQVLERIILLTQKDYIHILCGLLKFTWLLKFLIIFALLDLFLCSFQILLPIYTVALLI